MIKVIVFSRDRALQVQATLASFRLQARDADEAQVSVLYRGTSARHIDQYRRLMSEVGAAVQFVEESNFRVQTLRLLDESPKKLPASSVVPGRQGADYCLFLVDDSLFVRQFTLGTATSALAANRDALGFSFRLGRNTTTCYSAGRRQRVPRFQQLADGVLKYRWHRADGDFGYPLELSSSVYSFDTIAELLPKLMFDSPSSLESQMSLRARAYARTQPALLCFEHSVAFSAPLNRVQDVFPNRVGSSLQHSTENLADLFDAGKRLNVRALTGFVPEACHQVIQPEFE